MSIIYLTGQTGGEIQRVLTSPEWADLHGLIAQPGNYREATISKWPRWAADNGCFSDKFDEVAWLSWLESLKVLLPNCMFATLPDVVGDPEATLKRSQKYLDHLKDMGYPIAYVGQDGAVDAPWDDFDTLFIGGSTNWKISREGAGQLVDKALGKGKKVHMGRVNSKARLMLAESWGCHSADGNFLAFGPNVNLPKLLRWRQQRNLVWQGAWGSGDSPEK